MEIRYSVLTKKSMINKRREAQVQLLEFWAYHVSSAVNVTVHTETQ